MENTMALHFYDPSIKMSLLQISFTGCNQPPRSVLHPECSRRCCCLCLNRSLIMKSWYCRLHAMRIICSFSAMPQYQFFLCCFFRLRKNCCTSFDHL